MSISDGIPSKGATITHQAIEYVGPITRTWSRWTDGTEDHCDSTYIARDGTLVPVYVNLGADRGMRPPLGLRWVDTRFVAMAVDLLRGRERR